MSFNHVNSHSNRQPKLALKKAVIFALAGSCSLIPLKSDASAQSSEKPHDIGSAARPSGTQNFSEPDSEKIVTLKLKNKGSLTGHIRKSSKEEIVLDTGHGTIGVNRQDVARIIEAKPKDKEKVEKAKGRPKVTREEKKKHLSALKERRENYLKIKKERLEQEAAQKEYRIKSLDERMMVVEAVLNDRIRTKLLVDTGATYVGISPRLAKKLGYKINKNSKKIDLILANGSRHQGVPITLRSVKIGGASAKNVEAVAADRGKMENGILGMSFLNNFHVKIDPKKEELILRNK